MSIAYKAVNALKVPQSEVDAELKRLTEKDSRWKQISKEIQDLNANKSKLVAKLEASLQLLGSNYAHITSNASAIVSMHQQVEGINQKLDLEAVSFIKQMGQKARLRLLNSLYLMVKAYEAYSLKKNNEVDWNLVEVTKKINDFIEVEESKFDLDARVKNLELVFNENLQSIRAALLTVYSEESSYRGGNESFPIIFNDEQNPEVLKQLNAQGKVVINPLQYGIPFPEDHKSRILEINLTEVEFSEPLQPNQTLTISVSPDEKGVIRSSENFYSFYSSNPPIWKWNYSNKIPPVERSAASDDVLNWILTDSSNEIKQKVALPPLLSNLIIEINYNNLSSKFSAAKHTITKLSFEIKPDSKPAPKNQKCLRILTDDIFKDTLLVCTSDKAGRTNGLCPMIRIYEEEQDVQLSVPAKAKWHIEGQETQNEIESNISTVDNLAMVKFKMTEHTVARLVHLPQ